MSYRRAQPELSHPFIRSVFIVLLIVIIYSLQQLTNAKPEGAGQLVLDPLTSDSLTLDPSISTDAEAPTDSLETDAPTAESLSNASLFSEILLSLQR